MTCTCLLAPLVHSGGCPSRLTQSDVALQPADTPTPTDGQDNTPRPRVDGSGHGAYPPPQTALAAARAGVDPTGPYTTPVTTRTEVDQRQVAASRAVRALLAALNVPADEHTKDTPGRVARAYLELLAGYDEDPTRHLARQFPGPADAGLVTLQGIRFTSLCAHHLLPFTGSATVAYLPAPGAPIVGLSKLARVLEGYARRLQTQEVLGSQVADALDEHLSPLGAACIITAHHNCMGIRGVRQPDAAMTTSSLRGVFRDDPAARAELMALHHSH